MTSLRPFFLMLGRASVFWLGAFALVYGSAIVVRVATGEVGVHLSKVGLFLDASFIAILWFPATAGWLVGLVVQEFQHTSFAYHLPGVRFRIATGYLSTGLVVSVVVAGWITVVSATSQSLPLLLVFGLGAYCVGGVLRDPLSGWISGVNTGLVVLVIVRSHDLAQVVGEYPWSAGVVSFGLGAAGLRRLFARSTFRRKPSTLTKPLPGRFSAERSREYERRRRVGDLSNASDWRSGYLGSDSWAWVRAAFYESHGALWWRAPAAIGRLWPLSLIVVLSALVDKGELTVGEAVGRSVYDALFRSPHQAPFGEQGGPYAMVVFVIAGAGVATALFKAVALSGAMPYPLSRLQRARVAFGAGLVDAAFFLLTLGLGLYAIGHLTGLLVGYELRFDFMPFHFRVLMVTLVLMPLGHWGRFRLQAAARRKAANTVVGIAFGILGFVVAVFLCVYILALLFVSPILELITLIAALLISQWTYRQKLTYYYRTADLA